METVGAPEVDSKSKGDSSTDTGIVAAGFFRTYTDSPTLSDPINNRQLTATSFTVNEVSKVPEPSSAMLLLIGAAGVLTRRKR